MNTTWNERPPLEREAFEASVRADYKAYSGGHYREPDFSISVGIYNDYNIELRWRGWIARARAAVPVVRASLGTFACPICGKESPHEHTGDEIAQHRAARRAVAVPPDEE